MKITDFLLARITEDEAVAREAGKYGAGWHWDQGFGQMCNDPECPYGELMTDGKDGPMLLMEVHGYDVTEGWEGATHIALHDPARVLAECTAKRAIIDLCREDHEHSMASGDDTTELASEVLYALAAVYADHPDYNQEWKI